jgi:hypothetical protein
MVIRALTWFVSPRPAGRLPAGGSGRVDRGGPGGSSGRVRLCRGPGIEAGGRVRGRQSLDQVLAETLVRVDIPVVARGGVGSAERVAALVEEGAGPFV